MTARQRTAERWRVAEPWALVAAARGGDREAFGELYARYQPQIVRYIGSRVGDYHAAQDMAADTFVKALRNLGSVSDPGGGRDPVAWLTTIARNVVLDHAKSHRVRHTEVTNAIPEPRGIGDPHTRPATPGEQVLTGCQHDTARALGEHADTADPHEQVLTAWRHDTTRAVLSEAMRGLTPDQRQAIELYAQAPEQGIATVAEAMGRSVGAVKALRVRALVTMRAALRQQGLSSSAQVSDELPDPAADSARAVARARVSVEQARDALRERHQPVKEPQEHQTSDGLADLAEQAQQWQHHADQHAHAAGDDAVDGGDPDLKLGDELGCGRVA
jgi:RNA polymerase sigma-70 factor (ECF subfamily)